MIAAAHIVGHRGNYSIAVHVKSQFTWPTIILCSTSMGHASHSALVHTVIQNAVQGIYHACGTVRDRYGVPSFMWMNMAKCHDYVYAEN